MPKIKTSTFPRKVMIKLQPAKTIAREKQTPTIDKRMAAAILAPLSHPG
jgi:hypothetical protein